MTPQQAYNKGLDDAEKQVELRFTDALMGHDIGKFQNPNLELLRTKILNMSNKSILLTHPAQSDNFMMNVLLNDTTDETNLNTLDRKVVEILQYIKSLACAPAKNKVSVKLKHLLTELKVDFIKHYGKLN
jgi:hypothetical protein